MPLGSSRRVARITIEAPVVSFRYPHFLIGRQPTFEMPPPSTVLGHVASALGEWPRFSLRFAYWFGWRSRGMDLEHQQIVTRYEAQKSMFTEPDPFWTPPTLAPSGRGRTKKPPKPEPIPTSVHVTVQPHVRDFLFGIRWELYLEPVELADAFRVPVFPLTLGRSQDLVSVVQVETVALQTAERGYFEHTLLPIALRQRTAWGVTALMPRRIGLPPERDPEFEPFIMLRDRVFAGDVGPGPSRRLLSIAQEPEVFWIDPTSDSDHGAHRALWFHELPTLVDSSES